MPSAGALLLAHGAGGDADHPTFLALDAGLRQPVRRMRFPYRIAGKRAPDRAPVAVAAVRDAATAFVAERRMRANRLVLGGRSFGGRMCSMAVAEGLPAAGLVLLSYPLHPPAKPERLRVEHLADLQVPCLFVAAVNDPFGSPDEIEAQAAAIAAPVTFEWLPSGGHDPVRHTERIVEVVGSWMASLR